MANWYAIAISVIGALILFIDLVIYLVERKFEWYTWVLLITGILMLIVGSAWMLFYPDHPTKTSDELPKINVKM